MGGPKTSAKGAPRTREGRSIAEDLRRRLFESEAAARSPRSGRGNNRSADGFAERRAGPGHVARRRKMVLRTSGDGCGLALDQALMRVGLNEMSEYTPTGKRPQRACRASPTYLFATAQSCGLARRNLQKEILSQAFCVRASGAFILCESILPRQGVRDDNFCRPEAAATRSLHRSVGAMIEIIDWAARGATPRAALFHFPARAATPFGRRRAPKKTHRAVPSRSAARDGAMAVRT